MLILVKSMFLKCFFAYIIMRKSIDPTYITNTLSYIHLLPLNEQTEHFKIILQYFNMNVKEIVVIQDIIT